MFVAGLLLSAMGAEARTVTIDFSAMSDTTVKGVYVTKDYWFELSNDWEFPEPAVLTLNFSHSSIIVRSLSTLTVQVNGTPVESIYLDNTNIKNGKLVLNVPGRLLKGAMNVLSIVAKMRSDLDDLCEDVHNPGLWTVIEKESRFDVNYNEKRVGPDLKDFPAGYANPDLLYGDVEERIHTVVVMPAEPSPAELSALGSLSVIFGQKLGLGNGAFRVVSVNKLNADDLETRHIVLIGTVDSLEKFTRSPWNVPIPLTAIRSDSSGNLMEFVSPVNPYRRLLVVTGLDDDALDLVAGHLRTPASLNVLSGPAVSFDKPPIFDVAPEERTSAAFMVRLSDLKMTDIMARGKYYHSLTFTMPNPYVGKVKDGAFLRLVMSHSEQLLPQSSSLLVKVNGEPVRSIRLSMETAPRNSWDVALPLEYLSTRFLTFELELFMDIGDPDCYYNHPEMAWFALHNDTLLYLPVDTSQGETLANYPYMFLLWNRFDHLNVALVPPMTEAGMSAAFNVIAYLSQSLRAPDSVDLLLSATTDLSEEQRRDSNTLVIGSLGAVMADPALAAALPDELKNRDGANASDDLLGSTGLLALSRNPLNTDRRILTVTGRTEDEIDLAAPHLYESGKVEWIHGELAAVTQGGELKVLLPPNMVDSVNKFDPARIKFEDKSGKMVPVLDIPQPEATPAKHNVAYLVFFLLTPLLVFLVILRLRALAREGRPKG